MTSVIVIPSSILRVEWVIYTVPFLEQVSDLPMLWRCVFTPPPPMVESFALVTINSNTEVTYFLTVFGRATGLHCRWLVRLLGRLCYQPPNQNSHKQHMVSFIFLFYYLSLLNTTLLFCIQKCPWLRDSWGTNSNTGLCFFFVVKTLVCVFS